MQPSAARFINGSADMLSREPTTSVEVLHKELENAK